MGLWQSKAADRHSCRVLFLGLDGAGKTACLYRMQLKKAVATIPTISFNVETVEHKGLSFTCWDIRGQKTIRALWHNYYAGR